MFGKKEIKRGGLFECKCCTVLQEQVEYLKQMINTLHEKLNIPVLEEPNMIEDFKEEAEPTMNKDGFAPAEIHDD